MEAHSKRVREEIVSYLDEYFNESGIERPADLESYIEEQINIILGRIAEDSETVNPENLEGDYYRDSINEYGTVYQRYSLD